MKDREIQAIKKIEMAVINAEVSRKRQEKTEIETDLQRLEARHLENFKLLWNLKYGTPKVQGRSKDQPAKDFARLFAGRVLKRKRLAEYVPKVLGRDTLSCRNPGCSDADFEKKLRVKAVELTGLRRTRRTIRGIPFTVYVDAAGNAFIKGVNYENIVKQHDPDATISVGEVVNIDGLGFLLRQHGIGKEV